MGPYVYILRSVAHPDRIYTGISSDPARRLAEHNSGKSIHTNKYRPWKMIACVWFEDRRRAEIFERYLKTGSGRAFVRRHLIGAIPEPGIRV